MLDANWIELGLVLVLLLGMVWRWWSYEHDDGTKNRSFEPFESFDRADFSIYLYSSKREQCAHLDEIDQFTPPRA